MLDSNIILGTRGFLGCEEYEHGLLTQNEGDWLCGTPIVYPAGAIEKYAPHPIYTLITPSQRSAGTELAQVRCGGISPVKLKPLYKGHKILTVSSFDLGKFGRLLEFVKDVGGISLVIEYDEGKREVSNSIQQLAMEFKYSSLFLFNVWDDKFLWSEDDKLVCVLTFLDLPYCVPLFNMHKVDGVGLSFSGATIEGSMAHGYLRRIFRADIIYSNYEDNIFFIDGLPINNIPGPDPSIFADLNKLTSKQLKIGKPEKKKVTKKSSRNQAKFSANYGDGPSKWMTHSDGIAVVEMPEETEPSDGELGYQPKAPSEPTLYYGGAPVVHQHQTLDDHPGVPPQFNDSYHTPQGVENLIVSEANPAAENLVDWDVVNHTISVGSDQTITEIDDDPEDEEEE